MDTMARAAFINAQAACMHAKALAMQTNNQMAQATGVPPREWPHQPPEFESLPDQFHLGWNTVIEYLRN